MVKPEEDDAIYKKLRQVIKDHGVIELNTDSRGFELPARLSKLTRQKFLERIEPYMTLERAKYVRRLRVEEDRTWRGIAEAWEEEFALLAEWEFNGNQLAGMALCELAAKMFGEDSMKPPWN